MKGRGGLTSEDSPLPTCSRGAVTVRAAQHRCASPGPPSLQVPQGRGGKLLARGHISGQALQPHQPPPCPPRSLFTQQAWRPLSAPEELLPSHTHYTMFKRPASHKQTARTKVTCTLTSQRTPAQQHPEHHHAQQPLTGRGLMPSAETALRENRHFQDTAVGSLPEGNDSQEDQNHTERSPHTCPNG